ncbi:MAG: efflux RND transporter periplasmic adaptor subunit, partial [Bacteroidota bacterium]|nr:efflux RND transporter periplasmic adaptor subunit [Bacteroidota bacterium]
MKQYLIGAVLISLIAASCGASKKEETGNLNDKKAELQKLKGEQQQLTLKISALEKEIAKQDPGAAANPKLVAVAPVQPQNFQHFINLQGRVDATNISYVAPPNGQGGIVTALYVKQGDAVRKGQLLAKLDDRLIREQIAPLRVQLRTAEDTYRRTKNLFDQGIGTYQNVLNAQTQVNTLKEQIGVIQKQASLMNVVAPSSGVADVVNVRVGEAFIGTSAAGPQIRIVNTGNLKMVADVPENYLGKVGVGSKVVVSLPNGGDSLLATVNVAGKIIDPAKRTFYIEAPIPSRPSFKPNQIAVVRVQDYVAPQAITIPVNTLQNDDRGKYVMVAVTEKDRLLARKKYVAVGEL